MEKALKVLQKNETSHFLDIIASKSACIGIIGLGYVGLPLALSFAKKGFCVIGFDIDPVKPLEINSGKSYFAHLAHSLVTNAVNSGKLYATTDFSDIAKVDVIIICVPTPLTENNEPNLDFVIDTTNSILPFLRSGQLIVLESTTYPGTTSEIVQPIIERCNLRVGEDIFLAYSPEREDPGNINYSTTTIPKIVGADDPISQENAVALYGAIVGKVVPVSSMAVAEAAKLTENIFRAVNIAMVNELKLIFRKMDIDIWEVIDAAKTKPFGFMPFYPGPGLGGHCIPIDPFYLSWKANKIGVETEFIKLAGKINKDMPQHVVETVSEALTSRETELSKARVLLLGVAYKKNVDDVRESPAFPLIELLEASGAVVDFHDPFVPMIPAMREHKALAGRASVPLELEAIKHYDVVLICTDHDAINYQEVLSASKLVVDTRNATSHSLIDREKIVKA